MNLGVNPMSFSTSSVSWKSGDGVSDRFPAGLRVLVVDDDPTCLRILEMMLKKCLYEVTKCSRAEVALKYLRDNRDGFDIVISDVHMPDMDGFKLLEHVGLEMDLPVIMMSADDSKNVVMKGVTHGACDYLIKPVRMEALKNIWQHVVRKKKYELKEKDHEQSGSVEDGEQRQQRQSEDVDYSSSANEGHNWTSSKKRKDEEEEGDERDDTSTLKKPRVVWSIELHQQFVTAVNHLGIDKAVPKKILELMNVPGLTRENVASHLQKYRLYLKRLSGQHQGGFGNSFMGPPDPTFGPMTSLNSLELQALASSSQHPPQSLAAIQATAHNRAPTNRHAVSLPGDQRNIFSFENPRIRFVEGRQQQQQQQQQHNNNRQLNLLHGIPTNMDSNQLAALHQSGQPFGNNVNLPRHPQPIQIVQPQPRNQILNQPVFSHQAIPSNNVRPQTYASVSQPSALVDFSRSQCTDLPGSSSNNNNNTFLLMGNAGTASTSNYEVYNNLNQNRTDDWGLQSVGSTFDAHRVDVAPSVLVQPSGFSSDQRSGHSRIPSVVNNRVAFSAAEGIGNSNNTNLGQQLTSSMADNSSRIRPERLVDMGFQSSLFPDQFGQEDLMSALLKQHQEGMAPGESDFGFDGYHLDNLPV